MINDEKQIIFIHIPKNAGTSIEWALMTDKQKKECDKHEFGYEEWKVNYYNIEKINRHSKFNDYKHFESVKWLNYTKIAVIRNPYDRMVSWYNYLKRTCTNHENLWMDLQLRQLKQHDKVHGYIKSEMNHQELDNLMNHKPPRFNYSFEQFLQHDWKIAELVKMAIGAGGNYKELFEPQCYWVDDSVKILKYENLKEDFNELLPNINLPLINQSERDKDHYANYYTRKTADMIYNKYKEDFKKYNYEKL